MNVDLKHTKFNALVISGGSIKGLYFLGALKSLEENNSINNIKFFGGTSIGAIIALLIMIGYKSLEIFTFMCTTKIFETLQNQNIYASMFNILSYFGLYDFENISNVLNKLIINKFGFIPTLWKLEKLTKKKFFCVTYNLTNKHTEYITCRNFGNTNILDILHMSANLPIMFDKYIYKNTIYIDGGFSDNFPIKYMNIFSKGKSINIGLTLEPITKNIHRNVIEYFFDILMAISPSHNINEQIKNTKIITIKDDIGIQIYNLGINFSEKFKCFFSGYLQLNSLFLLKRKID